MYINSFNIDKPYNKIISSHCMDFPGGSVVKICLQMKETWIQPLNQEDPLEEKMEIHCSIVPEKSHGQSSRVGYSPWGRKEVNMTEWLSTLIVQKSKLRFKFNSVTQSCQLNPFAAHQASLSITNSLGLLKLMSIKSVSVQFSHSVVFDSLQLFAAHQASLSITTSQGLLKLMSIKSVMPSNHLILCQSFLLPPSIFPNSRVFSNESVLIRWPKYWSFSFSISPCNEYSGLISSLAVQGALKSLFQHHSSKASILQHSAFFIV